MMEEAGSLQRQETLLREARDVLHHWRRLLRQTFPHHRESLINLESRPDHPPSLKVVGQSRYVTSSRVKGNICPS